MVSFIQDEKGSLIDIIIIPVFVLVMFIVILLGWTIWAAFPTSLNGFDMTPFIAQGKDLAKMFDVLLIFMVVSVGLGSAILASQIKTNPVFLVPGVLFSLIAVWFSGIMGNVAWEIATSPNFIAAGNEMTRTMFLIRNLPLIVLGEILFVMIAMFARNPSSGDTGALQQL